MFQWVRWQTSLVFFFSVGLCLVVSTKAKAQSSDSDFSFFLGDMLPNQIPSIVNNLPLFGGRYAFNYPWGALEAELDNAHAQGVDWTQLSFSFRTGFQFSPGIDIFFYIGPALAWYIPNGATLRQSDWGVQVGLAAAAQVLDSLWLRADLKFLGNPGTDLYLLGGLMFRPGGSASP